MRNQRAMLATGALVVVMLVAPTNAQPPGREPGGGRGDRPFGRGTMRGLPLMTALDKNQDGELSTEEIAGAVEALRTLDKNQDGKLSADELRPPAGRGGGLGGPAGLGRPQDPHAMVARWMRMDKNGDEKLSEDELPERLKRMFADIDANQDGAASEAELTKFAEQRGPQADRPPRQRGANGDETPPRPRRPRRPEEI